MPSLAKFNQNTVSNFFSLHFSSSSEPLRRSASALFLLPSIGLLQRSKNRHHATLHNATTIHPTLRNKIYRIREMQLHQIRQIHLKWSVHTLQLPSIPQLSVAQRTQYIPKQYLRYKDMSFVMDFADTLAYDQLKASSLLCTI